METQTQLHKLHCENHHLDGGRAGAACIVQHGPPVVGGARQASAVGLKLFLFCVQLVCQ